MPSRNREIDARRCRALVAGVLTISAVGWILCTVSSSERSAGFGKLADGPTNSELIDQLVLLDTFGLGYNPVSSNCIGSRAFIGSETPESLVPNYAEFAPEFAEPMRELVRRGVDAMPDLVEHLTDSRTTTIGVRTKWHYTERYDGRPDEKRVWLAAWLVSGDPTYSRSGSGKRPLPCAEIDVEQHWVTVGDLCYVAIGQIVNRDFEVFEYGGENGGNIMSPTACPDLAESLSDEYASLSVAQHRELLVHDALSHEPIAGGADPVMIGAVKRLCFYYPSTGERVLGTLLTRDLFDHVWATDFVFDDLLKADDPDEWQAMLAKHDAHYRRAAVIGAGIVLNEERRRINEWERILAENRAQLSEDDRAFRNRANRILLELLPFIGGSELLRSTASVGEQVELLSETMNIRSETIDRLIPSVLDQAQLAVSKSKEDEIHWVDELIDVCQERRERWQLQHNTK